MTLTSAIALFATMIVLAAIPSSSVALVIARSAGKGVPHGLATAAGIVVGDLIFILLAVLGLNIIAETMAGMFMLIKYLGACYLIWMGLSLISARPLALTNKQAALENNLLSSFAAGFLLTLGDLKAIVFYVSFFPTFVDLENLRVADLLGIITITVVTVGGVKAAYAIVASRLVRGGAGSRFNPPVQIAAGTCMIGAGASLLIKQ